MTDEPKDTTTEDEEAEKAEGQDEGTGSGEQGTEDEAAAS